ncbi:hypothetical protein ES707_15038 [subsurface metagenome]
MHLTGKRFNLGVISVLVALLVVSIAFMGGCATQSSTEEPLLPTPSTTPVTPGYIRVYDYKLDYGFEYPEDWETQTPEVVDGEDIESTEMFTKPGTPTTLIVGIKLSNLTSLEEVKEEFKEGLKGLGGTILEEREVVVNGREGYEVIYKPIAPVKIRQVIFIANGKTYMLVCSTAELLYDEYEEIFDHVINSFVIK